MPVLDFADDHGAALYAALDDKKPAEILKTAEWREPFEGLDRDFALILVDDDGTEHRKYACHDPGNTLVSMFYLQQAVDHLNPAAIKVAAANLAVLGSHQGLEIPEEISKLAELELLDERDIMDERRVIYRPPMAALPTEKQAKGPYVHLAAVEAAWPDLAPEEKRASALELTKLASEVPLSVPQYIERYSGETLGEKFASHIRMRIPLVRDPALAKEYMRLGKVASVLDPGEVVGVLYELDNRAGLRWAGGDRYGEKVADPFLCVYDHTKEAEYSWNHGAEFVSETDLKAFPYRLNTRHLFEDTFSEGTWMRFKDDPVGIFKSMPLEQKILVSRMVRQRE